MNKSKNIIHRFWDKFPIHKIYNPKKETLAVTQSKAQQLRERAQGRLKEIRREEEKSAEDRKEIVQQQLETVYALIDIEVDNGKFSLLYEGPLDQQTIDHLRNVDELWVGPEIGGYTIRWDK